jgi:hypothetical protein
MVIPTLLIVQLSVDIPLYLFVCVSVKAVILWGYATRNREKWQGNRSVTLVGDHNNVNLTTPSVQCAQSTEYGSP